MTTTLRTETSCQSKAQGMCLTKTVGFRSLQGCRRTNGTKQKAVGRREQGASASRLPRVPTPNQQRTRKGAQPRSEVSCTMGTGGAPTEVGRVSARREGYRVGQPDEVHTTQCAIRQQRLSARQDQGDRDHATVCELR